MTRSLRILQVIETGGPGGAETVFANVCTGLQQRGHDVHCLVAPGSWLPDEMRRRGFTPIPLVSHGAFDVALLRLLHRTIREHRIDIVHAHLFEGALYSALAARLAGVPCVATLHGQVDLKRGGRRGAIKRWLFSRTVSALAVVSDALGRELAPLLSLPPARLHTIPNGVLRRTAVPVTAPRAGEAPSPPAGGVRRLIAIGNIRQPKGYPVLLDALHRLRQSVPRVHLDIVGEPDRHGLYDALQEQVSSLGLSDAVTFHGFLADPLPLLSRADVFVLASSQEGFSLATIEAMLAGIPVVATRSGGPEEILRHGETGLLVPVGQPPALAAALQQLLDDPTVGGRLAQAAQQDASARYSLDTMVGAYERLYAGLLPAG